MRREREKVPREFCKNTQRLPSTYHYSDDGFKSWAERDRWIFERMRAWEKARRAQ